MGRKDEVSTPMMKQYLSIKESHPGDILLFRMGDFYEMFFEDAETAARILDIALTSRDGGNGVRVPMAGVPHHSAESYIQTLLDAGQRVAICEQMEDASPGKGLVKREVVRIITPGARMDAAVMGSKRDNLAAAVAGAGDSLGMAVADISTGYFACVQVDGPDARRRLTGEFARHEPRECCVDPDLPDGKIWREDLAEAGIVHFPELDSWVFEEGKCRQVLRDHFGVSDLAGFGCDDRPQAVRAAGGLLQYLREVGRNALRQIVSLQTYSVEDHLIIDPVARRTLELTEPLFSDRRGGTLLGTLDRTQTPMGGRLLRRQMERPLRDPEAIRRRLDAVEALVGDPVSRDRLQGALRRIQDLERLSGRISYGTAGPRDMAALRDSLGRIPGALDALSGLSAAGDPSSIWSELADMDLLEDVREELEMALVEEPAAALREGGIIRPGYDEDIDQLRRRAEEGKSWIAGLEVRERERTGIKSLKVGHNKVFGYYLEVTHPNRDLVPDSYERKQTLVNSERYVTPELKEKEAVIFGAEERLADLEYRAFVRLREATAGEADRLLAAAASLAQMDFLLCLALVAAHNNYCRPVVDEGLVLDIVQGRHPVLEAADAEEPFVPNDSYIDCDSQSLIVVTGPNMSGKSTYLRQVGLIVIMAQMGSFVPAKRARIGVADQVFTRIGAADDLTRGRSTFMMEMIEVANILNNATTRSLLILDEVGRGTSTYDGISIAW
ncbi:MAG: DNA mismatch repair protein MutS, partial [Bacillota bacterium]